MSFPFCFLLDSLAEKMLWFFTLYAQNKKMFQAWDQLMQLVPDPGDWVCMLDGDTAFLLSDFGHQIQAYIDKYRGTGIFTCYASRCANRDQLLDPNHPQSSENPSILFHRNRAESCFITRHFLVKDIFKAYGHLMVIQKQTWDAIREQVKRDTSHSGIFNTDTSVSRAVRHRKLKIKVMEGVYILHYYRLKNKGRSHLL